MGDPGNTLLFSAASLWEIAIKRKLGRNGFKVDPRLLRRGLHDKSYDELPISSDHAIAVDELPPLHKDLFDRILIAQAMVEGVLLLTADPLLAEYPAPVRSISCAADFQNLESVKGPVQVLVIDHIERPSPN